MNNDFTGRFKELESPLQNNSVEQSYERLDLTEFLFYTKVMAASACTVDITIKHVAINNKRFDYL